MMHEEELRVTLGAEDVQEEAAKAGILLTPAQAKSYIASHEETLSEIGETGAEIMREMLRQHLQVDPPAAYNA